MKAETSVYEFIREQQDIGQREQYQCGKKPDIVVIESALTQNRCNGFYFYDTRQQQCRQKGGEQVYGTVCQPC